MSVTFPTTGEVSAFLDNLQREANVQFSNAAVLVKQIDGKTSLRETHDVDQRQRAIFGAITGGLLGLLRWVRRAKPEVLDLVTVV